MNAKKEYKFQEHEVVSPTSFCIMPLCLTRNVYATEILKPNS